MKKAVLYTLIGFFCCTVMFSGCSPEEKGTKVPREKVETRYNCPMKCTEQIFDKPGKCPKCGIELVKITES